MPAKKTVLTDEQRAQVEMLTNSIVNKILHMPTVKMKEVAGRDQCYLYVDAVRTLFDLDGGEAALAGSCARHQPSVYSIHFFSDASGERT